MVKKLVKKALNSVGLEVTRYRQAAEPGVSANEFPLDFEPEFVEIIKTAKPYTMTSNERLYQLALSVKYLVENGIKGDLVECGVWRGGSILVMIETLKLLGVKDRKLHLFDTFSSEDILNNKAAGEFDEPFSVSFNEMKKALDENKVDLSVNLAQVKETMKKTGYPEENVIFHVGRVEDTIPQASIDSISLLRLDTDWYDSTKFQLENLYHLVNKNGIVICDDYGFWKGHRQAIEEFLSENDLKPLLMRNDWSCRLFIKNV